MGACLSLQSRAHLLPSTALTGNNIDYTKRFTTSRLLGQGEFGAVHLVFDNTQPNTSKPLASKMLKKGMTFKDSTLHFPIKPRVLKMEVEILELLQGQNYNLHLVGVYESPSVIYLVTEYCSGGDMMQYLSQAYSSSSSSKHQQNKGLLRTEDVSRISYQLLSAVSFCAERNVLHRDIKPENIMFCDGEMGSELRLIDYGSGTIDHVAPSSSFSAGGDDDDDDDGNGVGNNDNNNKKKATYHQTFAGTPFYISPQVFRRHYTTKTDVWSVGVTLYVLVAGYPAEQLQKVFNMFHNSKRTSLRTLPNVPHDMPDSYWDMLESCLAYKPKDRWKAKDLLECEFVQFHRCSKTDNNNNVDVVENNDDTTMKKRVPTKSLLLPQSTTQRHASYLNYRSYERSVTALLATTLLPDQFRFLLHELVKYHDDHHGDDDDDAKEDEDEPMYGLSLEGDNDEEEEGGGGGSTGGDEMCNKKKLRVISIGELKKLLIELKMEWSAERIENLPYSENYDNFAYRIALLQQFSNTPSVNNNNNNNDDDTASTSSDRPYSSFGRKKSRTMRRNISFDLDASDSSVGKAMKRIRSNLNFKRLGNDLGGGDGGGGGGGGGGVNNSKNGGDSERHTWVMDDSIHSTKSAGRSSVSVGDGRRAKERHIHSVHGGNVWETLMKNKRMKS